MTNASREVPLDVMDDVHLASARALLPEATSEVSPVVEVEARREVALPSVGMPLHLDDTLAVCGHGINVLEPTAGVAGHVLKALIGHTVVEGQGRAFALAFSRLGRLAGEVPKRSVAEVDEQYVAEHIEDESRHGASRCVMGRQLRSGMTGIPPVIFL